MNDVECSGHEQRITDCSYGLNKYAYHYNADVLVRCPSPTGRSKECLINEGTTIFCKILGTIYCRVLSYYVVCSMRIKCTCKSTCIRKFDNDST